MIRLFTSIVLSFLFLSSLAQAPAGYYTNAEGKSGYELKTALKTIITNGHNAQSYSALYSAYVTGDTDPEDGFVWDMYSENPTGADPYNYSHGQKQCGNYTNEGDCYNREHIMPQSVFSEASPMVSDFHHIYPSDGKVNGMRSNNPFGEVSSATWTSRNGSKLGANSTSGYSATVFEPLDEFKGDIARALFYFATRYETQVDGWSHAMLNGTENQVFSNWFLAILLDWHKNDPVSTKETVRNNAGYSFQGNRNPYVDHPEWVLCIWENNCSGLRFSSTPTTTATQDQVYTYSITVTGGEGKTFTISKVTATTATLTGTPTPNNLGENTISLKVSDGTNETLQNFVITVTDGNSLAFTSTPIINAKEGVLYSYTINATGNDGKTLAITAETKPSWLSFASQKSSSASQILQGTPTANDLGAHSVSLKLTDGSKTMYQNFTINVVDASAVGSVIITQYYEGSVGNNKFIEITNVGLAPVDLTGYYVGRWSGTSTPTGDYVNGDPITGTIAAGETKVFKNADSNAPAYAISTAIGTTACYFNGDDPVALLKGGKAWSNRVDCIYAAGVWGADKGFYRKPTVTQGNINISVLDGTGEWVAITEAAANNATSGTTEYIGYHSTTSTGMQDFNFEFKMYPNPTENKLIVEASETITQIEILSITGQKLIQLNDFSSKIEINTSTLSKGIYFIHLTTQNELVSTQKFIKK